MESEGNALVAVLEGERRGICSLCCLLGRVRIGTDPRARCAGLVGEEAGHAFAEASLREFSREGRVACVRMSWTGESALRSVARARARLVGAGFEPLPAMCAPAAAGVCGALWPEEVRARLCEARLADALGKTKGPLGSDRAGL